MQVYIGEDGPAPFVPEQPTAREMAVKRLNRLVAKVLPAEARKLHKPELLQGYLHFQDEAVSGWTEAEQALMELEELRQKLGFAEANSKLLEADLLRARTNSNNLNVLVAELATAITFIHEHTGAIHDLSMGLAERATLHFNRATNYGRNSAKEELAILTSASSVKVMVQNLLAFARKYLP